MNFLLVKNIGKNFQVWKFQVQKTTFFWITFCWICPFRFHENSNNVPILAIRYQFLKTIMNCKLTWKFEASVPFDPEMAAALSVFSKICEKSISLADIFQLHKYQGLSLIQLAHGEKIKRQWEIHVTKTFALR